MAPHGSGMRSFQCLMVGMACMAVGAPAAWANTGPSPADERGPRLQITAPGKTVRLPQPPPPIDRTTTASIPKLNADQQVERAFANPTPSEIALGIVPGWTAPAFVAHLATSPVIRPQVSDAEPASPAAERPVPRKAVDPTLAFLAFPLGDEKALPFERMGGGYLASYVPEPLLQIAPEEFPKPDAPANALPKLPEAMPPEAQSTPEAQPKVSVAPSRPPVAESVPPADAEKSDTRSVRTETPAAPAVRSQPLEPELPPSLLPTRPPLAPG